MLIDNYIGGDNTILGSRYKAILCLGIPYLRNEKDPKEIKKSAEILKIVSDDLKEYCGANEENVEMFKVSIDAFTYKLNYIRGR